MQIRHEIPVCIMHDDGLQGMLEALLRLHADTPYNQSNFPVGFGPAKNA